jgi:hypothetical protein
MAKRKETDYICKPPERILAEISKTARKHQQDKDRLGFAKRNLSGVSDAEKRHGYLAANYALSQFLGSTPQFSRNAGYGDKGVSYIFGETRFCIKHSTHAGGDIRLDPNKVPKVDFFVLARGDESAIHLVGWCSRQDFMDYHQVEPLGDLGERWLYPWWKLQPMQKLLEALKLVQPEPEQLALL